ncbi:MAG TPA: hypothetical protein VFB27_00665 [Opitutaceae bacterium]|nr:hypothetical protein [Opitutaceae bacterium]
MAMLAGEKSAAMLIERDTRFPAAVDDEAVPHQRSEPGKILGLEKAAELARRGRMISAIKQIEAANPRISRTKAVKLVWSLGYGRELRWPEHEFPPARREAIRCL